MSERSQADVLIRIEGRAGRITLNRPQALNALNHGMVVAIEAALRAWESDGRVALVVIDAAGDRAFCAGGDIAELYRRGLAGDLGAGRRFWAEEYRLNRLIRHYPKPFVALMDGIVMGGGVGLSAHGSHRIVTERSMVAMPECAIGLVPDVGASLLLATAPGRLGEYLGLTGFRMGAADAILAGFADVAVASDRLAELVARLVEIGDPGVSEIYSMAPADAGVLAERRTVIDRLFEASDAAVLVGGLSADGSAFAAQTLEAIRKGSPLSVAATLAIIRTVRRDPTIETALRHEYRFTFRSQEYGDLQEGIRAAVIDKDRTPRWSVARLEDLPARRVEAMLAPLRDAELTFEDNGEERP
ncbi:enoyl-CoA hydratase/isomerase family protein [Aurantimonas aggregata]|uniref:3-hydroxyisobutyryl-CoA hydrolase n=1 Tax=Aurantimonas aggregata TaxID=2047720 RepID=A0A6L9MDW8_9HYPH|nr:enoyl-CoA hydratase/isomerase family protein [Aurantimonas aggregata]NDV86024.1 enoyl-CoA hydratase/isomerase family protein [Aurantimonas aggregata]